MANTRDQIPENLKWNTAHIYEDISLWEADYKWVQENMDFSAFHGKLNSVETVKECFDSIYRVSFVLEKLYVYASMRHDEDTRVDLYTGLIKRARLLAVGFSSAISFLEPELTALDTDVLEQMIADSRLKEYDYELKRILKNKPHVLSSETEKVLAMAGQVFGGYREIYSMIDNADMDYPVVKTPQGEIKVSSGGYSLLLRDPDPSIRKEAFQKHYACYHKLLNTITSTYAGNVNKNFFLAKARKFNDCLDMALSQEDVTPVVYNNLIKSVHDNFNLCHRYMEQKKKALKLDKMHMWDVYVPIVENAEVRMDYEEAFELVKKGLAPLGEEYIDLLNEAHDNGWIDVEETPGKRSGAYCTGVYALKHPYVLLNYQKTTSDIFTIAHELGHSMHTHYSNKNQPISKANYTIFVAEVASTVNEVLLLKYLLNNTTDNRFKKFLLSYYTDMIKSTLFRQTMFAEFEYIAHEAAKEGKPLTKDFLCAEYLRLNKAYYGEAVEHDEEISWEWARIPHFYSAFYVYKYATGIISAITIAENILKYGQPAVERYKKFLSAGGSDSPVELLKIAGVDLTDESVYSVAMQSFKDALDQFDNITL